MKKWAIKLIGHKFDLEFLFENQAHPAYSIVKIEEEYYIESPDFNDIEDYNEVKDFGTAIIEKINGVAAVVNSKYEPVKLDFVSETDENGNRIKRYFEIGLSKIRLSFTSNAAISDGVDVHEKKDLIQSNYSWIENNEYLFDATIMFGKGKENLSWFDLYMIGEMIDKSNCRTEVLKACNMSKEEVDNFMANCNYYRHYHKKADKPEFTIISKSEAFGKLRRMLKKWAEL